MKSTKKAVALLTIILPFMNCSGQIKTTNGNSLLTTEPILLRGYLIDPIKKTVSRQEYWERSEGDMRSWGYDFPIDTSINFETTCLYVMDNYMEFKEYYKPKKQLEFTDPWNEPLDISLFNYISEYFYEKDGICYFASDFFCGGYIQLRKTFVESGINLKGLRYAGNLFFYDNKGLYYVQTDNKGDLRLITIDKTENCHPVIKKTYCEYNGKAFTLDDDAPKKISADPAQLYEIDLERDGSWVLLTDVTTIISSTYGATVYRKIPGLSRWIQLSNNCLAVENNCINLSPSTVNISAAICGNILFFSPDKGFFTVARYSFEEKAHYDRVIIYNYDKDAYEDIEVNQFEMQVKDFFTYKGRLHYQGVPVENDLNGKKLQYLQRIWGSADWLSDGNHLFNIYGRKETGKDLGKKISFATVLVADIQQLKVVTEKLLVDNVYFYQFNGREIEVIPIESLGVEVKLDLSTYAWQESK